MVSHSFGLSHHTMLDKPQSWSNPTLCLPPHLQMCSSMAKENHKIILTDFPSSSQSLSASSSFRLPSNHILLFWSIHLPSPRGPLTSSPWKVPLSSLSLDELLLIQREKGSDQNRITTHTMHLCTTATHLNLNLRPNDLLLLQMNWLHPILGITNICSTRSCTVLFTYGYSSTKSPLLLLHCM